MTWELESGGRTIRFVSLWRWQGRGGGQAQPGLTPPQPSAPLAVHAGSVPAPALVPAPRCRQQFSVSRQQPARGGSQPELQLL